MKAININPGKFERGQVKIYAYIIPVSLFMLIPIVYVFTSAFKPLSELFQFPPSFFVERPTLNNFFGLAQATQQSTVSLARYTFNSLLVTGGAVLLAMLILSMAGYALSKLRFKKRELIFEINTIALMFVPVAVTIPRYMVIDRIGVVNTYWAHLLPLVVMPVGLFLLKQFIDQVPDELLEAAKVDGAGSWLVYFKVVCPLIKPALATVSILTFQAAWGNVETSNLYTTKESMRTLAFFMNTLVAQNSTTQGVNIAGQGISAAAMLVMFVPNIVLFIILQSKVMNTMAHSGLK